MPNDEDEPDVIIVHLRRRTPAEQIDWLIMQVSFLVAKVNRLERDNEALTDAVLTLESRLSTVERATPWTAPKKPPTPPGRGRL